jgi:ketosteroid isomerase-like protein
MERRAMPEKEAVLAANLEFYRAFTARDLAAMDRLWARKAPVACTHPGWVPLAGRSTVMASWHDILSDTGSLPITCHDCLVLVYGAMAMVLCEEEFGGGHFAATNVFITEDGAWRLLHHHASALPPRSRAH